MASAEVTSPYVWLILILPACAIPLIILSVWSIYREYTEIPDDSDDFDETF